MKTRGVHNISKKFSVFYSQDQQKQWKESMRGMPHWYLSTICGLTSEAYLLE